ncbi:P2Y purinoceptor 2 [Protopterus annectens]|uniref:P2Y purinoceptor 2 n=1 Tax=Protopterus annectens TaxID=7888 RepID=UPI001CFAD63A|nr:P2Y purinoceptor 2 [Protopterus annectens]
MENFTSLVHQTQLQDYTFNSSRSPYRCKFNEEFKYVLLPVSYGIVFIAGLILNAVALHTFLFRMKQWNACTTFMFNLAVCDTLYVISLPLLVYYYGNRNQWPFSAPLCKIVRFLFYTNLYCSILFLSCISIHRFLGICFPVQSLHWGKVRNAQIISIVVWTIVVICQAPVLSFVSTGVVRNITVCHDTARRENFDRFIIYTSFNQILLFCIPFAVVLVCYCLMANRLMKPSKVGPSHSKSKKKSIRMIIIVLTVFIVCFLPFHITRTLYYSFRSLDINCKTVNAVNLAYKITRPLASVNSCLDPILYFLAGQKYRKHLTLRNQKTKRQKWPKAITRKILSDGTDNKDPTDLMLQHLKS